MRWCNSWRKIGIERIFYSQLSSCSDLGSLKVGIIVPFQIKFFSYLCEIFWWKIMICNNLILTIEGLRTNIFHVLVRRIYVETSQWWERGRFSRKVEYPAHVLTKSLSSFRDEKLLSSVILANQELIGNRSARTYDFCIIGHVIQTHAEHISCRMNPGNIEILWVSGILHNNELKKGNFVILENQYRLKG